MTRKAAKVWLSQHFQLSEFLQSSTADRLGIDNVPTNEQVENMVFLCCMLLEKLRRFAEKPIKVTSGFRCNELNKEVGGVVNSYHTRGMAADLAVESDKEAMSWAAFLAPLDWCDLVIFEKRKSSRWLHVQWSKSPRHKMITKFF